MRTWAGILLVFAVTIALIAGVLRIGGSVSCTTEARTGLLVTVRDRSGALVCNASVVARSDIYTERLGGRCTFTGLTERAGTYTLTVRGRGVTKVVDKIVVTKDVCHVHPRHVTVTLPT